MVYLRWKKIWKTRLDNAKLESRFEEYEIDFETQSRSEL